ncbi:AhpD family alkylhydroperoxidase [Bradyrhizobium sp. i1.3.1]
MATVKLLSDDELSAEARAVFDDIRKVRKSDFVNNFWRALAHDPKTLRRTWESIKEVMAPGALDPKIKEMLYVAVSIAHGCSYCIHSHTAGARAKGMTEAEYGEMLAIVGMAVRRPTGWSRRSASPSTRRFSSMPLNERQRQPFRRRMTTSPGESGVSCLPEIG